MTTDITELAPLKPGKYAILYRDNWDGEKNEYHTLAVLTEEGGWYDDEFNAELLKYQGDKILKVWPLDDGSNILALVEALEKAQTINAAAEKLVRCKGRYHSEQNYRALAALFGVNTPDLPPLDGESRTVTVKLPEVRITVAEALRRKMTYRELDAYNAGALASVEKIQAGQTDAGIKWEAE